MFRHLPLYRRLKTRLQSLSIDRGDFFKSLSFVTLCFVISKVFSSVAAVAYNRYLGAEILGETRVITLVSQLISVPMMCGLHASMMKHGSHEDNPSPEIATAAYLFGVVSIAAALLAWLARGTFQDWLHISDYKMMWAIVSALSVAIYQIVMTIPQTLHQFKLRGYMEILMAGLLLPGMALAHLFVGRHYENQLIALALSYGLPSAYLAWRMRTILAPRWLFSSRWLSILKYGLLMGTSNLAFLVIFVIQPLQIKKFAGEVGIGLFTVYSIGSLQLATLATGIFFSVFFPKMTRSHNKHIVWQTLSKAWVKAAIPAFVFFSAVLTLAVWLSGKHEYPLHLNWVIYFALASTLITIHATYAQIITSEGVRGTTWGMIIAFFSAGINYSLTDYLVPRMGVPGAAVTLAINYSLTLAATVWAGQRLILRRPSPPETS